MSEGPDQGAAMLSGAARMRAFFNSTATIWDNAAIGVHSLMNCVISPPIDSRSAHRAAFFIGALARVDVLDPM